MKRNGVGSGVNKRELVARVASATRRSTNLSRIGSVQALDRRIATLLRQAWSTGNRVESLIAERRWLETDIHGYERALAAVDHDAGSSAERLLRTIEASRRRLVDIDVEVDELARQIRLIRSEIETTEDEVIEQIQTAVNRTAEKRHAGDARRRQRLNAHRLQMGEIDADVMWSPMPVYGYRVWQVADDGYYGVRKRWALPAISVACPAGDDVPHTDGRCAEVAFGCGIYAAKSLEALMNEMGGGLDSRLAVGVVALEGVVVEHERGYRAEHATVRSLVVVDHGTVWAVDDEIGLYRLFMDPAALFSVAVSIAPPPTTDAEMRTTIKDYLEERAERCRAWI